MRVRDSGRGIRPESLPLIFDLFHKGDSDGAGLGIGLAVVKGLTEMHGGFVEARSAGLDQGSEFVVKLPAATTSLPMA
jgi:signal transduction histidine kinase